MQTGIQSPSSVIPVQTGIHHDPAMNQYYVYILASQRNGTLYIGMTNNLIRRVWEHKTDAVDGFTQKHGVHRLVWYEIAETPEAAITREKQLKKWNRAWKLRLIEEMNPKWEDLYEEITG
jgi:putative endonuclease